MSCEDVQPIRQGATEVALIPSRLIERQAYLTGVRPR